MRGSGLPRAVWVWSLGLLGVVLLAAGCTSAGPGPSTGHRGQGLPPDCTYRITRAGEVSAALAAAAPGATVCFSGVGLADSEVAMTRSGTARAPIRLVADGLVTVRSVQISADHVILEGFTVASGDGVLLRGVGIAARNNTIRDTRQGGITCDPCTDSSIEYNSVSQVATAGIWISGQRITVHANTISNTVPRGNGDADGMRFFGTGHRITNNTIVDISDRGYANPPHPDCFQTYDENRPLTFDVLILGNSCRDVGAQCLIATGDQSGNSGAPPAVPSITFVGNTCASNGAQAINLRRWPNVQIRQNTFSGPNLTRAVLITDGSTGATVIGNTTTTGGRPTVDIDDSSRPGSRLDANRPA